MFLNDDGTASGSSNLIYDLDDPADRITSEVNDRDTDRGEDSGGGSDGSKGLGGGSDGSGGSGGGSGGGVGGGSEENVFDPTSVYEITNTATTPGSPGYGYKYYSDGTAISPEGKYFFQGQMVYDPSNPSGGVLAGILGKEAAAALKGLFVKADGSPNLAGIGSLGAGLYGLLNKDKQGGYSRPVPKLEMVREQIQYNDPNRRPGEGGRQYFTDPRFVAEGKPEALAAGKAASAAQASGIQAAYKASAAQVNPYAGKIPTAFNPKTEVTNTKAGLPAIPTADAVTGGLGFPMKTDSTPLAEGGLADAGRYLRGETDGMADKIPSNIDGEQPAALSHGEFVIPADVVSHLGNGNSDAGAQKLYEMMSRIRQARTGSTKQGKEIDADEFTMGGLAYAYGGQVQKFTTGGAAGVPLDTSKTSTLSPYVGEYVTDALAQGRALANAPMEVYKGPLTAGASDLQQQAFAGASDLASAGFTPGQFNFGAEQASQYMNPYLQASLDPQLKELKRQSDIARLDDAGRLTRAGAFGGSRQAVMESEGRRNLLDKQASLIGSGYKSAFDTGMGQFNRERDAEEASRKTSADFGLKSVAQLAELGATQRGITSEGLKADKEQFDEQREFNYAMPKYQLGLLSGLPIAASTSSTDQDAMGRFDTALSGLGARFKTIDDALKALSVAPG